MLISCPLQCFYFYVLDDSACILDYMSMVNCCETAPPIEATNVPHFISHLTASKAKSICM